MQNIKILTYICSWAGWLKSSLKTVFFLDEANIVLLFMRVKMKDMSFCFLKIYQLFACLVINMLDFVSKMTFEKNISELSPECLTWVGPDLSPNRKQRLSLVEKRFVCKPLMSQLLWLWSQTFEPRHEISINVVCETSKAFDQPAHKRSQIRALASRLNSIWGLSY